MARGGAEHRAAAVDVRSGDCPLVDGPREMDPETHEVADAREAARRARRASATARAARTGRAVFANSSMFADRSPIRCPWQSHRPGRTTGARSTLVPEVAFGAPSIGPA